MKKTDLLTLIAIAQVPVAGTGIVLYIVWHNCALAILLLSFAFVVTLSVVICLIAGTMTPLIILSANALLYTLMPKAKMADLVGAILFFNSLIICSYIIAEIKKQITPHEPDLEPAGLLKKKPQHHQQVTELSPGLEPITEGNDKKEPIKDDIEDIENAPPPRRRGADHHAATVARSIE